MGWRDRDWARLSDVERRQLYGDSPSSVRMLAWCVAALMGLFAIGVVGGFFSSIVHRDRPGDHVAPVVYGGAVDGGGSRICTTEEVDVSRRVWVCIGWAIVQPGQTVALAADPGGRCGVRHVDQAARAWSCDSVFPPRQNMLPTPHRVPPPRDERIAAPVVRSALT
jgi:hypothetical protein